MEKERRKRHRRKFSYYMRVLDEATGEPLGHLSDISAGGFKLDSQEALPLNAGYQLRIDLPPEIANKNYMTFEARSRWCRLDPLDHVSFNAGFQIVNMTPGDFEIYSRMFERYGTDAVQRASTDYLWK